MADVFIYFLILVVVNSKPIQAYFLNDDLGTNLPDRFGDPIDENWQDKRSVANELPSFSKKGDALAVSEESTDFDYRNGNAETDEIERNEKLQKRESELDGIVDERLNEEDIRQILPRLSHSQRETLDSLMKNEDRDIDIDKRQLLKQNFENSYHLNKRHNFKMPCKGLRCEEYDRIPNSRELVSEEDGYRHCPEKVNAKRKLKFKRSNRFRSTSRENILQAKVSLLKDNYKRSSEMRSLEDSANRRYSQNKRKQDSGRSNE